MRNLTQMFTKLISACLIALTASQTIVRFASALQFGARKPPRMAAHALFTLRAPPGRRVPREGSSPPYQDLMTPYPPPPPPNFYFPPL